MTDVCFSKQEVRRLGGMLEDSLCDVRDVIEESELDEKTKNKMFDETEGKLQKTFIKIKKCSCTLPIDIAEWERRFKKGMLPWK